MNGGMPRIRILAGRANDSLRSATGPWSQQPRQREGSGMFRRRRPTSDPLRAGTSRGPSIFGARPSWVQRLRRPRMQESFPQPIRVRARCGLEGRAPQKLAQLSNIPGHRSATGLRSQQPRSGENVLDFSRPRVAFETAARRDVARSACRLFTETVCRTSP